MDFLLDAIIPPAMAQAAGAAQPSPWQPIIMLGVFFLIFWFFLIRPRIISRNRLWSCSMRDIMASRWLSASLRRAAARWLARDR